MICNNPVVNTNAMKPGLVAWCKTCGQGPMAVTVERNGWRFVSPEHQVPMPQPAARQREGASDA